jgi:hypothetical protein
MNTRMNGKVPEERVRNPPGEDIVFFEAHRSNDAGRVSTERAGTSAEVNMILQHGKTCPRIYGSAESRVTDTDKETQLVRDRAGFHNAAHLHEGTHTEAGKSRIIIST